MQTQVCAVLIFKSFYPSFSACSDCLTDLHIKYKTIKPVRLSTYIDINNLYTSQLFSTSLIFCCGPLFCFLRTPGWETLEGSDLDNLCLCQLPIYMYFILYKCKKTITIPIFFELCVISSMKNLKFNSCTRTSYHVINCPHLTRLVVSGQPV